MELHEILQDYPGSISGPATTILSNEKYIYMLYYMDDDSLSNTEHSTFSNVPVNRVVTIRFYNYAYFNMGEPSDDQIDSHPYSVLGLNPYKFYEIVHEEKESEHENLSHYIFSFRHACVEIVCEEMVILSEQADNIKEQIANIAERL